MGDKALKLNQIRRKRILSNAFIKDDVETNKNKIVNHICEKIRKSQKPQFIVFL